MLCERDYMRRPLLSEIVGQPPVRHLQAYCAAVLRGEAASKCFALVGPPGCGKSTSAYAVAEALDADDHRFGGGLTVVDCTQLGVDACDTLFRKSLKLSVCNASRMRVVILEEFEWVSAQVRRSLKFHLDERNMPRRCVVIATSNKLDGFEPALLSRFKVMPYGNGHAFMLACQDRIRHLWARQRPGQGLPMGFTGWGRSFEHDGYDMRSALASLDEALAEEELVAA